MARGRRFSYREPAVTLGTPMPIPEVRSEVLQKIDERLDTKGPFLQEYSNGEFTSSSLAVARTFDECKAVRTLDGAGYTIHHDAVLNIYWRKGGCWD